MSEPIMQKSQLKLWFLIPLLVFIAMMVMFVMRLGKPTNVVIDNSLNRPVPSFELPLLSDISELVNNEVMPNHPYLINVWGSWCTTCHVEHPFLLQLQSEGVDIVGVNYDDELNEALAYLRTRQDPFIFSLQDSNGSMVIDLGLTGAPETFVVDATGNIRQHIVGEIHQINWDERIKPCFDTLKQLHTQGSNPDSPENQQAIAKVCV